MRRRHQLLARLYRAGAGNHDDLISTYFYAADVDNRAVRLDLLTDQLEWLCDRSHVVDAGGDLQGFDLMPAAATYCGDDGTLSTSGYVRLVSGFTNPFNHVLDLLLGCSVRHVDNHWWLPLLIRNCVEKAKAAILENRG